MAGFIILQDGRAYAAANWAFRATVEVIAEALPITTEGQALSTWLKNDPVVQVYNNVDVRELTEANRDMFLAAAAGAYHTQKARGPIGWSKPESWDGWINRFAELVRMIECVKRGDPADDFNPHMTSTIPPTGDRKGPGW